jgi:hypothetical protein
MAHKVRRCKSKPRWRLVRWRGFVVPLAHRAVRSRLTRAWLRGAIRLFSKAAVSGLLADRHTLEREIRAGGMAPVFAMKSFPSLEGARYDGTVPGDRAGLLTHPFARLSIEFRSVDAREKGRPSAAARRIMSSSGGRPLETACRDRGNRASWRKRGAPHSQPA